VAHNELHELVGRKGFLLVLGLVVAIAALVTMAIHHAFLSMVGESTLSELTHIATLKSIQVLVETTVTLLALVYGASCYQVDLKERTLLHVLSRPVSRAEFVFGKWCGVMGLLGLLEMIGVSVMLGYAIVFGVPVGTLDLVSFLEIAVTASVLLCLTMAIGLHLPSLASGGLMLVLVVAVSAVEELQNSDSAWLRMTGRFIEYATPAEIPDRSVVSDILSASVDPRWPVVLAVQLENVLYGGLIMTFSVIWLGRKDLSVSLSDA
jgi:hypothetical protein